MGITALSVLALALGPGNLDVDYQRDIRPLLAGRCFACHGPDKGSREAGLRLDSREAALEVLSPGDPGGSELLARVSAADPGERMPPADAHQEDLSAAEVALLAEWIGQGASYDGLWSFQPVRGSSASVDELIDARLAAAGLEPGPEADPRTLLRRLHLDLTGLAPSAEDVDAFAALPAGEARDAAYAEHVERLLASPQHAERLAVWWLDLVRYGDSSGYHSDRPLPAWPYRDWVLRAFMENMPFDRFTALQLAGDLVPDARPEDAAAAAFQRLSKATDEGGAQAGEYVVKYAADRVRTTSTVWLGLTVGCAECHDHKYDPILQRDFYSMAAFFADVEEVGVYELREYRQFQPLQKTPALDGSEATCVATVSVPDGMRRTVRVLGRGDWMDESGEVVQAATPASLPAMVRAPGGEVSEPGRLELARWLVQPDHPLTSRVLVNRLWALLFGAGLSPVLDDLGVQGEYPSHPELLDALAAELVDSGWDMRSILRTMLQSRAYRRDARSTPELDAIDPANRLLARQSRWRLDAEFVRDGALRAAGLLDDRVGGPSVKPYQPTGYWQHLNFPSRKWEPSEGADQHRRGLYTHWQRTYLHPALLALDAPSREESTAQRARSNTPLAALVLLNDPSYVEAARVLGARLAGEPGGDAARVGELFRRVLQRSPSQAEAAVVQELVDAERAVEADRAELLAVGVAPVAADLDPVEHAAWTQAARAVLNLHEAILRP